MHPDNDKFKCIDKDYLIIKQKLGEGAFCKVKDADVKVYRDIDGKQVQGIQNMAVKIFNKPKLRN